MTADQGAAVLLRVSAAVGEENPADAAATLPDAAAAAVAGLRTACLGLILTHEEQAIGEDALFAQLMELGLREWPGARVVVPKMELGVRVWRGGGEGGRVAGMILRL